MNRSPKTRIIFAVLLSCVIGSSMLMAEITRSVAATGPESREPATIGPMPDLQGDKAIAHLKQQGTYGSLNEAVGAVKYQAAWQAAPELAGVAASYELKNAANNLLAYISADGLQATSLGDAQKSWRFGLQLSAYGYVNHVTTLSSGEVDAKDNLVEVKRSTGGRANGFTEWFLNTARGIEHGFTIAAAPAEREAGEQLRLRLVVSGDLQAQIDSTQKGAFFSRATDNVLLCYDKLFVKDAKGRTLSAIMKTEGTDLLIDVDDATAEYPLTIDPLLRQLQKVTAADGAANDNFGYSVAISGDTAVIGAVQDTIGANAAQGSSYVFVRIGATWTQQAKLIANDGAANDQFGYKVAISGDTIVVGAVQDAVGGNVEQGSAYIFQRSGATWTQQEKLTASDGAASDVFGASVAISVDTVAVGAPQDDIGAALDQGSVYIFQRSGVSWVEQAKLTAGDGEAMDEFGFSVGLSGNVLVVGSPGDNSGQGSGYIFERNGATWSQRQKLIALDGVSGDNFGYRVALDGNTAVIVSITADIGVNQNQGAAYVFVNNGATWLQQQKLVSSDGASDDFFGFALAVSGDTLVIAAPLHNNGIAVDQGAAYVFTRNGISWTQQQKLLAADGAAMDGFGTGVGLSGNTIVVGADADTVAAAAQGSAYFFICNWTELPQLTAADGAANDNFGFSVAISGDTAVVGAPFDDTGAFVNQGAAYVFTRNGTSWAQQQKLTASDMVQNDNFGFSVAISGDTIVIGANSDDINANPDQGSAYVFTRNGTIWTEIQNLTAADGGALDAFGSSVAISGDTVAIGAPQDDTGATVDHGSAYVFVRSGATFSQQQKLIAADGATGDKLGNSIALSGDTLVVGAPFDDVGFADQGSAYIFQRTGNVWSLQQKLTASDGAASDFFGTAVAISGDTVVVGAPGDDIGVNPEQGSAYIFTRNGIAWLLQQKLTAAAGSTNDFFGNAIGVSGDMIVVGVVSDTVAANPDQGSVLVFARSGATWFQLQQLVASDGAASDDFGVAVAIDGNSIIVGADLNNIGAVPDQGSAYIYFMGCNTAPTLATLNLNVQKGSPASTKTLATVSDSEDPIGSLIISVASAPAGISITNITNTNGMITAQVAATCSATFGNNVVTLRVTDSDGGTSTATQVISATANTPPVLGIYPNSSVAVLASTAVTPNALPSDNGSIVSFSATSPTFTGIISVTLESGLVTINNARPSGTHVFTVTAVDNCGITTTSGFTLSVTCQTITVNPSTIPAGTAGSAYTQIFTQTGGNGVISFGLTGALPTGLSFDAATATLSGTPTQVGTFPIIVNATDENNCAGSRSYSLVIGAQMAVWNGSISSDWHTASNWTPNLVPGPFTDVLIPTASVTNEPIISAASSSINALTIQPSRVLTINPSLQLSTAANITTSGTIRGTGKLAVAGANFSQNGTVSLASVEFASGNHVLAGGGAFASGIITILSGADVTLVSNHSVSVIVINSGGMFDATNQTVALTGAGTPIFNSGSFNATGSTLIYQGSVSQAVTANINYDNLTINNTAGVSLAGDTTVNGQLNLLTDLTTGSAILTMPVAGTSAGDGDVIGDVRRVGFTNGLALSFGNPLNTIRFDSGLPPGNVTVNLVKSTPGGFPANVVSRTYTITPQGGSGFSATLRLRYRDSELNGLSESSLELWRFNGSTWQSPAGAATRDTSANWAEETGITAFSPWAIAGPTGPTLVELISFSATAYDRGVFIEWQTGFESNNLGFNLYREESGQRKSINPQLVAGSALTTGSELRSGQSYDWWDPKLAGSENVAYWLEDIDLNNGSTWHGPFYPKYVGGVPPARSSANAAMLGELNRATSEASATHPLSSSAPLMRVAYAPPEVQTLASQLAAKISVNYEGWYHLSQGDLSRAGFNPNIDPRLLQLFVDGRELPITVQGENDGSFDPDDSVEFYGTGLDSPFSQSRVYWLTVGSRPGLRVRQVKTDELLPAALSFSYTVERRDRSIYFAGLLNGERENFFGAVITTTGVDQQLTLSHLASLGSPAASVDVLLQGVTVNDHRVRVDLNGTYLGQVTFNSQQQGSASFPVPSSLLLEGRNIVRLTSIGGPSDISLVDHLRISYPHAFSADNGALKLSATGGQKIIIDGFAAPSIRVSDVTDSVSPVEVVGTVSEQPMGYTVTFVAPETGNRTLLSFVTPEQPAAIAMNRPSDLRQTSADFIIITRSAFADSLNPLVLLRQRQGLSVALIDAEDIYDEFSFGNKTPYSIRDFLAFVAANSKRKPACVLFAGDASFDPNNYLGLGDHDFVPTRLIDTDYMEAASDDWFTDTNDDGVPEIATGRLPIRSAAEAETMINKIIAYEQSSSAGELSLAADEGYEFEQASNQLASLVPAEIKVNRIYRGQLDPIIAKKMVLDGIQRGQKIVNYAGHGSTNVWRGNFLTAQDVARLEGGGRYSVFLMMTCLNGFFHDATGDSLAESLIKVENGGAVAVWASSGLTRPADQGVMNQQFYRLIFRDPLLTLGEAARRAKAATSDRDVRKTWILLGDPSMRLK